MKQIQNIPKNLTAYIEHIQIVMRFCICAAIVLHSVSRLVRLSTIRLNETLRLGVCELDKTTIKQL